MSSFNLTNIMQKTISDDSITLGILFGYANTYTSCFPDGSGIGIVEEDQSEEYIWSSCKSNGLVFVKI